MKGIKSIFFLFCLLGVVSLFSCQSEESDEGPNVTPNGINAPIEGTLLDGGEIASVSLYCLENDVSGFGMPLSEYYPKIKIVQDYNAFTLYLFLNRDAYTYMSDDANEMRSIGKIEDEYCKEKSWFLLEDYKKYKKKNPVGWPVLFTAYANGEVSVTCDKILFGEKIGTNLSSYFSISAESACIPIGIENPRLLYDFGQKIPNNLSEFFVRGTWLQPKYILQFAKQPSEKYEELTLYISVPILIEHMRDYAVAKYKGIELASKYSEATYKAECRIKFNWK